MTNSTKSSTILPQKIDKEFFEEMYRTYWRKLFGICLHHTQNETLSEEIVQDIFRSLWERRDTFVINGSIENYLVRATKLEIMEHFRTATRRQTIRNTVLSSFTDFDESTEQGIYAKALEERINELVCSLPGQCQEVYTQSRVKGLTNTEIASVLSISVKTVEYHITRALSFLRTNLSGYDI